MLAVLVQRSLGGRSDRSSRHPAKNVLAASEVLTESWTIENACGPGMRVTVLVGEMKIGLRGCSQVELSEEILRGLESQEWLSEVYLLIVHLAIQAVHLGEEKVASLCLLVVAWLDAICLPVQGRKA